MILHVPPQRNATHRTSLALICAAAMYLPMATRAGEVVNLGIGTQNTTTNTVTGGIVIKELKLLEKYLPKTGKYKDIEFKIEWQNFTSGPPVTNGMIANKLQIGMMGDYPLMVNGATGQQNKGNETRWSRSSPTTHLVPATVWLCTRTAPITTWQTSRARRCPCRLDRPRTA